MLLGFDILLHTGKSILNMVKGTLTFDGQEINLDVGKETQTPIVARVTVAKRQVIPPNSVVRVKCSMDQRLPDYVMEPVEGLKVIAPRVVRGTGQEPLLCLINPSDRYRLIKKGMHIAKAYPIEDKVTFSDEEYQVQQVSEKAQSNSFAKEEEEEVDTNTLPTIPPHVEQVFNNSAEHLNYEEKMQLAKLLIEYQDVFARDEFDLGNFSGIEHSIDTGQAKPIKQRMRRTPVCFMGEEEAHLKKMLEAGVIQESTSEWASAPVLIRKRDGTVRWCVDYRALNDVTVKDVFPLPLVDDCLDTLAGSVWFSKLDANSAYWQIKIKEEDRSKTAFITKYGLFEHVRMAFGLCNSPATYSRVMNLCLRGLSWKIVLAFLDDVLVLGKSFHDHLVNLAEVLTRFRNHGLRLKSKKCIFFQKSVEFLGRVVSENSISMSDVDIKTVRDWPTPQCSKDVERFVGLANYHREFVKNFSKLAAPLYQVVGKHQFKWEQEQETAFAALKVALTSPPVLALPNREDPMLLDTDASDFAIGAELIQIQDGKEKVIAYGSYSLTAEQRRYCATRKELLAVVRFTRQYRHWLLGRPFQVRTDHSSLAWLMHFKDPQGQLARWLEELSQYNMIVKYREGRKHVNVDSLSRMPAVEGHCQAFTVGVRPEELPCGGCKYCLRADKNWRAFTETVDDTVPLVSQGVQYLAGDDGRITGKFTRDGVGRQYVTAEENDVQGKVCGIDVKTQDVGFDPESPAIGTDIGFDPENLSIGEICNGGSDVVHVDIVMRDNEVQVITVDPVRDIETSSDSNLFSWGFSLDELREAQRKDEDFQFILEWCKNKNIPSEHELFIASPATKSYWLNKEQFCLIDGVLYQTEASTGDKKLVVPKDLRTLAVQWNHDLPSAGHQGRERTKHRVKEKFTWFGLSKFVSQYVAGCEICNKCKKSDKKGRCPMTEYQAGAPMERVHLDFLGPLPKSKQGNEYVLVIVDQFTKWVECIPLPTQTAEETARAAVDQFFTRFGFPFQIYSDQGRNFESKLFKELCKALQIHKARTTPYRPSSNGQVERYNRTLLDAVRCFIGKKQDEWDIHLQQIAGALRASVNRQTGYTANRLMLGREVNMPAHLMFPHTGEKHDNIDSYVGSLTTNLQEAHEIARSKLKTASKRMKRNYDLRLLQRNYEVGDVVHILDEMPVKGQSRKLRPPWKGPGIIIEKFSSYLFRVKLRNAIMVLNHDKIKLCRDRTLPLWIRQWKQNPRSEEEMETSGKEYCICRQPWEGRFMIQCDDCDEWYHGSCVNLTPSDALHIDRYRCSDCQERLH